MKKNIFCLIAAFALLTSCLDDKAVFTDNGDYGIVELDLSGNRAATAPYANRTVSRTDSSKLTSNYTTLPVDVIVNYTGRNGTPKDVTVTVELDASIVDTYRTNYTKTAVPVVVPSSAISVPSSNTLTIPKGQKTAVYTVNVNVPALSTSVSQYGIGVKITSASDGRISGNFGAGIYLIGR